MSVLSERFVDGSVLQHADTVILYGAGRVGRDVCRLLTARGTRVLCFLDREPRTQHCEGVPVLAPTSCPVAFDDRTRIPVVLSIFNREVDIPELALTLRGLGFTQLVSFVDAHAVFPGELGDRFWLTRRSYVTAQMDDIAAAEAVWADDASRTLYRSLVAFRCTGAYDQPISPIATEIQYFPSDVPGWLARRPLRVVDCGAYDGDTLETMARLGLPVEAVALFEPDTANFARLARTVQDQRGRINAQLMAWPCAVSDRIGVAAFQGSLDEASGLGGDGATTVPTVALDDILVGWQPTFIKMDVEGAEVEALLGAQSLITQNSASLAVCVYHRPDHLWRIPLMLSKWAALDGYRYYLRAHAHNGFDTVMYACPDTTGRPPQR
jgi:FkbM family methyltransferase